MKINLKPEEIPQYTGHLETLEKDHAALKKDAENIRSTGADVHSHFQGLSAFYKAPEAEQLFATTKPVKDRADAFAGDLETVASALADYADEIRPLKTKLENLKKKAQAFIRDHTDDDDGDYDDELTAEHNQIRDDINATVAAFWAAERTCYNKIVALWHGPKMVAGDGSKKEHQYGFKAEDLKNAKVPWGDPVELKHHWYDVGHWLKSFAWDGIVVDGIWGTIKGLGTLVGVDGWDAAGQAWKGLAQLGTGLAILTVGGPGAAAFMALPDDKLPSWLRDSRNTMKQTGKALVAWDEWGKNPGRAAGGVTFNVLTTVLTGGAGGAAAGAGKAGAVAKALSVAGKVGKAIDPMTYVGKAAGAGLSKVGDIAKSLRGAGKVDVPALPEDMIKLPEGTLRLPDGTVHLPEGASIPEGATRLPDGNVTLPDDVPALPKDATPVPTSPGDPARYFDGQGNLLDEHGKVLQSIDDAPKENVPHAGADEPRVETPTREPALVGAGARAVENGGHVRLGDSVGRDVGDVGRTGDDVHPTGTHADDRLPGAGDHLLSGRPGEHFSGGSLGDHMPGSRADDLGTGPSASHETPSSHTGVHGGGAGEGHGGHADSGGGHGNGPEAGGHHGPGRDHSGSPHSADHEASAGGHGGGPGMGDDAAGSGGHGDEGGTSHEGGHGWEQELSPERRKKILEEQIWKANNDDAWFEKYYRPDGHRWSIHATENGAELPILAKDRQGNWISKHALPSGPSEAKFDQQAFHPGSVRDEHAGHLDDVAKGRRVSVDLNNAEREFKDTHSEAAHQALHDAQEAYTEHHGDTPNNSKHSEKLGEDAARYHVIPEKFPDAEWVELPKTANGANMFDQLYKLDNGDYLIVEAKAPSADLGWRQGVGDTAGGMMVKQGTKEYVHTILQEMWNRGLRSPRDAELADELFDALEDKKLQYVLVKANDNPGTTYAGAVLEHFRIN